MIVVQACDARLLAEADRSARAARRARIDGRCVECGAPYEPGTWIILTDTGTAHRACLRAPDPLEAKRGRPHPPKPASSTVVPAERPRILAAVHRGRCAVCRGWFYAGESIAIVKRPVHAACAPQPVTTTMIEEE